MRVTQCDFCKLVIVKFHWVQVVLGNSDPDGYGAELCDDCVKKVGDMTLKEFISKKPKVTK